MTLNLCICGAQAGYAHDRYCPWPYYGHDPKTEKRWEEAHNARKAAVLMLEGIFFDGERNYVPPGFEPQVNEAEK